MDMEKQEYFYELLESDQTDPNVQYQLGCCFLRGEGVEADGVQAEFWLRKAADQGQEDAIALLNTTKETGMTGTVTADNLLDWCAAAEGGDPEAQYQVALYFREAGYADAQADIQRYLRMAAAQGHPKACTTLGEEMLDKDPAEAVRHLKNAADCGEPQAMNLLAKCYAVGRGVAADAQQAERWFIAAAERGGAKERLELALRYKYGKGVACSPVRALNWVKQAQLAGMDDAMEQYQNYIAQRNAQAHALAQKEQEEQARVQAEQQRQAEEAARLERQRRNEEAHRLEQTRAVEAEARRLEEQERLEAWRRHRSQPVHQQRQDQDLSSQFAKFAQKQGSRMVQKLFGGNNSLLTGSYGRAPYVAPGETLYPRKYTAPSLSPAARAEINRLAAIADPFTKEAHLPLSQDLIARAKKGDAMAQWEIGWSYFYGIHNLPTGAARFDQAAHWLRLSAEQGNPYGQYAYGVCHFSGAGVPINYDLAVKWWRKAADQGHASAAKMLNNCRYNKDGFMVKVENFGTYKQEDCYATYYAIPPLSAPAQAEADRQKLLFETYVKDPHPVYPADLVSRARSGDADAQWLLGYCYRAGINGFAEDYARFHRAAYWLKKAADQGHANGQYHYAWCVAEGAGVEKSLDSAAALWRKAADQGHTLAAEFLGKCRYGFDDHVSKIVQTAFDKTDTYYTRKYKAPLLTGEAQKTAEHHKSMFNQLVKDKVLPIPAGEVISRARGGDSDAQFVLGYCYYYGASGLQKNVAEAAFWLRKSAEQGNPNGQHYYGCCLAGGSGVRKDLDEAVLWFRKAADGGQEVSVDFLNRCHYGFDDHVIEISNVRFG